MTFFGSIAVYYFGNLVPEMEKLRFLLLGVFCWAIWMVSLSSVQAQFDPETADRLVFRKTGLGFGAHISTTGIGIDVQYFKRPSEQWEWTILFRAASVSDPRERRVKSLYSDQGGKDFVYDKLNYAYTVSLLYGWQRTLFNLDPYNQTTIKTGLAFGPTLGILKPYYLDVAVNVGNNIYELRSLPYNPSTMAFSDIVGEGNFSLGTDELKYAPGMTLRWNTMFNMGGSKAKIRAVNVGLDAHFFFNKLRIMAVTENRQFYMIGFVGFLFGSSH